MQIYLFTAYHYLVNVFMIAGLHDLSSSSMMSAATPSSSHRILDFTTNSFYIPSFSSIANTIESNPNSIESKHALIHGGPLHSPSFLELPAMKYVSKAFHIEIWFITHSKGNLWICYVSTYGLNAKIIFRRHVHLLWLYRWYDFVQRTNI